MKKISAAFDGLKFSTSTMNHAIQIAIKSKALLSGVFLEDFTYHSYKIFDMVGSQGVSGGKIKTLLTKDKETRLGAVAVFEKECVKEGVNYTIHHDKNIALQELTKESIYSDLLLIGADETLTHFKENRPIDFIRDFLTEVQCPVLLTPKTYKKIEKVVLLYDGKPSSVFAIKMFNYLMPWMVSLDTEVLSVNDPEDNGYLPDSELIKEFVVCHYPNVKYTLLNGNAKIVIVDYLKKIDKNTLVVLGAYKRGSVSMFFKKSLADILMKELDLPLFIAHQ